MINIQLKEWQTLTLHTNQMQGRLTTFPPKFTQNEITFLYSQKIISLLKIYLFFFFQAQKDKF